MSIIDDALKKTQDNLQQKEQKPEEKDISSIYDKLRKPQAENRPTSSNANTKEEKKPSNPIGSIFFLLFLLGALYLVYQFYYAGDKSKKYNFKKFKLSFPKTISKPKPTTTNNNKPNASSSSESINLNGIVSTDARKAALLNNKIYEVGEEVNGMKIISISVDEVELMDTDGNIKKLSTRN